MQKTKIINQTFKYLVSAVRIFINFAKILGVIPPEHGTSGDTRKNFPPWKHYIFLRCFDSNLPKILFLNMFL